MLNKHHYRYMGEMLIIALLVSGCQAAIAVTSTIPESTSSPTGEPTHFEPAVNPTDSIPVYGPVVYPVNVDPLTGLVVDDPTLLDRCPMLIKVSNYPRSGRPHAGLSMADLVFDYYIGEGMNRFAAVYYGRDVTKVGPIRSGRLVDAQLATLYHGILAFKGAWFKVNEVLDSTLKERAISGAPSTCPGICDTGSETVISMFANTSELEKYSQEKGICGVERPDLTGMVFSEAIPADGRPAMDLAVNFNAYNRAEWHYDKVSGTYLRWIESISGEEGKEIITMVPLTDANTGLQLAFDNVVILFAKHDMYAPTYFDIQLQENNSGARAVLLRDGKAFDGVWKSAGGDKPLQFLDTEGEYLPFKPGNTWLVIVGSRSTLIGSPDQMWELTNELP
ncbi:MAG: DUF3048 domain-containing protein [Anaerolineaceae bacterium]